MSAGPLAAQLFDHHISLVLAVKIERIIEKNLEIVFNPGKGKVFDDRAYDAGVRQTLAEIDALEGIELLAKNGMCNLVTEP